jgi:NADH-quinone oxidoreductase subunit G
MAIIFIDNKPYEVKAGKNLLEACLTLGFNLPYFCWHPAMGSVGACRQCAVKLFRDEQDQTGRLVMSCMEPIRDNMYLSIEDSTAKAFRSQIIEWLMTNHPHDCAVCDEGGSCHLQDMTVMTGHTYRRFQYKKRTYTNQYLGPFINHEMNRCIQCYRCVRFYKDYAGGKDLDVFAAHDHVYFGRAKDGILENEFSGNLAEVCPTGVFTDKTLKEHYTRKWDMTMAPSICQHCSLGCNIIAGERYGELRQITSRFNGEVNGYFICDRGRFGYEFVNSINRIQQPLIRGRVPEAVNKPDLFTHLKDILSGELIGIGSPRASLESNYALRKLVGKNNFYQGVSKEQVKLIETVLQITNSGQVHIPSIKECEQADVVLILGEDLTNSAPRLALAVRQAVIKTAMDDAKNINLPSWHDAALREFIQEEKGELLSFYPLKTKMGEIASQTENLSPDEIARLGYAIANLLNPKSPAVENLEEGIAEYAKALAEILKSAVRPLIISGTSLGNESIIKAAANIAFSLKTYSIKASLNYVVPECNSMGLAMMQAASYQDALNHHKTSQPETLVILETDLERISGADEASRFISSFKNVIVIDHLHNSTSQKATVLIPIGTFAEGDGTLVNNEGRAQCFFQVFMPANENIRESWRWLDEFKQIREGQKIENLTDAENLMNELVAEMPQFKGAETVAPNSDFRINGQKIPREPHRYSGRTAMLANINVNEPKPPEDRDTPLSFTMEGFKGIPPAPLIPFFWSPGWNSVQSINKYQAEVGGPLHGGDPGKRLFPENETGEREFLNNVPAKFLPLENEWLIIPLPHIFGSEELSIYSKGVKERSPEPYIALGKMDAEKLNIREGETLQLKINDRIFDLKATIKEELAIRVAGVPLNIPDLIGLNLPAKGTLTKAKP